MSTMEHLFMHIFERKEWIEDQMKQQIRSCAQSLASNLIAEGGRPPPWLWAAGSSASGYADPKELSREQLISEILFQPPQPVTRSSNCNTLFTLPTSKGDNVSHSNYCVNGTVASNKYFVTEGCKAVSDKGKAVEAHAVYGMQCSRLRQMGPEFHSVKKAKTLGEFTGRVTRSMVASRKFDCSKESSELNKNSSVFHGEDGGRDTRPRSTARKRYCNGESSKPHKLLNVVEDCTQEVGGSQMDNQLMISDSLENRVLKRSGNIVASRVLEVTSLVESEYLLFDGITDCGLHDNSVNAFGKESQGHTSDVSVTNLEAVQLVKEPVLRDCKKARDPSSTSRQFQDVDATHTEEIMLMIGDSNRAPNVVDDPECSQPTSCISKPRQITLPMPSKEKCQLSEKVLTCSSPVRPSLVRDSLLNSAADLSVHATRHQSEERCSRKTIKLLRSALTSKQREASSLVESNNLLFDRIEKSDLYGKSVDALEKENHGRYSENALSKLEALQSVKEESALRNFKKAYNSSVELQFQEEDVLHTAEGINSIDKVDRVSDDGRLARPDLLETEDLECDSSPTLDYVEPSHLPAATSLLSESALSHSSPVTENMLNSVMDLSGQLTLLQDDSKRNSLESSVRYVEGEKFIGKLIEETSSSLLKPLDTAHSECSTLFSSETFEVLTEVEEAETAVAEVVESCIAPPKLTPDACCGPNATVNVGHKLRGSDTNFTSSTSHSSLKSGSLFESQETVVCPNPMQKHAIRHKPNSTDINKSLSETCYFLRSSASLDKKSGSRKRSGSVLQRSEENCIFSEAHTNEIHACTVDVAKKDATQNSAMPNSGEVHNAQSKARYLLRSLTSHCKDPASFRSNGMNSASILGGPVETIDYACEITWPERRKMNGRYNNILATSPMLRFKSLMDIQMGKNCIGKTSSKNSSGATMEFHPSLLSSGVETNMTKDDLCFKGKGQALATPLPDNNTREELLPSWADDDFNIPLKDKARIYDIALDLTQDHAQEDGQSLVCARNILEHDSAKKSGYYEKFTEERGIYEGHCNLSTNDSARLSLYDDNLASYEETMPEFEGFSIAVPSIVENEIAFNEQVSLLNKLSRFSGMLSPVPHPSKCKINKVPDGHQSLPAGLWEHMNCSDSLQSDDVFMKQFRAIEGGNVTNLYCNLRSEFDSSLLARSPSYSLPSSSVTPPVKKLCRRVFSGRSGTSSEVVSSNPEFICFRIDENSSTTEENVLVDEYDTPSNGGVSSRGIKNSTTRKALADVTSAYQNASSLVSLSQKYLERGSLDSVNSESYYCQMTQMDANMSLGNGYTGNRKYEMDDKENCTRPVSGSRVRKAVESFCNRSNNPELFGRVNERNRSQALSEKGCKPRNTVSNTSSFIPPVRQRQAAVPVKGKRDIKVKALEAAEAAKRLEVKKLHEREMRKTAARLERSRSEQENGRQLELIQKQKEVARKKKEADFAARKRQREEESKDKDKKRRCTEEARRRQREREERLHAEKEELRRSNAVVKEHKRKESSKETKRQLKLQKGKKISGCMNSTEVEQAPMIVAVDVRHGSNSMKAHETFKESNDIKEVVNSLYVSQNTIQDRMSVTKESEGVRSYMMSPYKDSDDEDGQEDIRRQRKCIPSWARRECLDQILLSKRHIDPTEIFSRKSSFKLTEVLSRRIHQGPLSSVR